MVDLSMSQFEPLSDYASVYRVILRKKWINEETNWVKADAYFLRATEIGLSVYLASECSPEHCAGLFNKCYGVASLEVRFVREIGLDVEQDSTDHANIVGLPYRENNLLQAERLAGLLAKRSHILWLPN